MSSTPTTRNRLLKQGDGDNVNTWGDLQGSGDFDMIDVALDGVLSLTVTGNVTLTTANFVDDQARRRVLKLAGSVAATITIPSLEKWYLVWNTSTAAQTIASSGGGSTVTIQPGEAVWIACDATNVVRTTLLTMGGQRLQNVANGTASGDAVNYAQMNAAITAAAYSAGTFGVAITAGDAGKILTNNGSTPNWGTQVPALTGIGGMTSAYPALNRNGANLEVKLADGSSYTGLTVGGMTTLSSLTFASARSLSDVAVGSDIRAATSATKANTPKSLSDSAAWGTLTDAPTIAWALDTQGYNAAVTLTASGHTIGVPTLNGGALYDGCPVLLAVIQDATGGCTATWASSTGGWDFGLQGLPTLPTGANKVLIVSGIYRAAAGMIEASVFWRNG